MSDRDKSADQAQSNPPRWATRILEWYCKPELLEDLQGDLNECFERNVKSKGRKRAELTYVLDVLKFFRSYTIRKPKQFNPMNNFDLLQNNFKTSLRSIGRNKLFTAINVSGLAVAMCLGLVIIAMVVELKSFDIFHEKYDRIYRVRNTLYGTDSDREEYASTSLRAAKQIKEDVSGVEEATILRRGFKKDVSYDGKTLPLNGLWADESFFNIFSFELLSGDASTVLKHLNTVVLTEKSAQKLFGSADVAGKSVQIDSTNYTISAVVRDPPINSHLRFEMLGSLITIDSRKHAANDADWMKWDEMWSTYVYVTLPSTNNASSVRQSLSAISTKENKTISNHSIKLQLQPLSEVVLNEGLSMEIGPTQNIGILWTLGIFAFIVIISACFNYTNLSIARALKRAREVGIRKVTDASRLQVFQQFIFESLLLSLLSLVLSYFLFIMIRAEFISMDNTFREMLTLQPSFTVYLYFLCLAVCVGIFAGLLPALFFSKVNAIRVLKDLSSVRLFKHINLRKGLIIFQYSLSLFFIVAVGIEYRQYQYSLNFDLGFETDNILTLDMQGNKATLIEKELSEVAEVKQISKSSYISSVGDSYAPGSIRYQSGDSVTAFFNFIDENYIPLHGHKILAGQNFNSSLTNDTHVIVNEKAVQWMKLPTLQDAIGEEITIEGKKMKIIGVVQDFNHDRINHPIQPFAFRSEDKQYRAMSLKIQSIDVLTMMQKINNAWKKIDPIHPLKAEFYNERIANSYNKMSWMARVIGSVAFLAVFIASLGLLGMVIFTTETRLKEISIRKVLGASDARLVLLMSNGFIQLLIVSAVIGIPAAYYLFDQIIFDRFAYRAPIGIVDLFAGAVAIIGIAFLMIGAQTLKVAQANPAQVLKSE